MPKGIGTLSLAAKLMQAAGGEMVVTGAGAAGHDIRWRPLTGGYALIERKDRAYAVGTAEPFGRRMRHLIGKIWESTERFPRDSDAGLVLAVGFPG